jgi:hypothetical protein
MCSALLRLLLELMRGVGVDRVELEWIQTGPELLNA